MENSEEIMELLISSVEALRDAVQKIPEVDSGSDTTALHKSTVRRPEVDEASALLKLCRELSSPDASKQAVKLSSYELATHTGRKVIADSVSESKSPDGSKLWPVCTKDVIEKLRGGAAYISREFGHPYNYEPLISALVAVGVQELKWYPPDEGWETEQYTHAPSDDYAEAMRAALEGWSQDKDLKLPKAG